MKRGQIIPQLLADICTAWHFSMFVGVNISIMELLHHNMMTVSRSTCHAHPPCHTCAPGTHISPGTHIPLPCLPPCMPPLATHTPCHAHPLPRMPPPCHTCPPVTHVPLPCMPPPCTSSPLPRTPPMPCMPPCGQNS